MTTYLAYADYAEILDSIVNRLRDQLQLTQKTCFFVLNPDKPSSHVAGGEWYTVSPLSGTFSQVDMDGGGLAAMKTDTGFRVRINSTLRQDPINADKQLILDQARGVVAAMRPVLKALAIEWNPLNADGEAMLREPPQPRDFDIGDVGSVGYIEVRFAIAFDWELGER